jgi:diazepam-binding inhibitor (GABA receptor modulating acyl-CoA-binding protein)
MVDLGITVEQAQEKYVSKVEELKGKYGYDESKDPEQVGGQ